MLLEVKLLWFEDLDSPTATTAEKVSNDVSSFDVSDFKIDWTAGHASTEIKKDQLKNHKFDTKSFEQKDNFRNREIQSGWFFAQKSIFHHTQFT